MGLKDSLKKLFSTSKEVGAEKVEQSIDQAKEFAREKSERIDEVVDQTKETIREFTREADEKVKDFGEKIRERAEETKDKIEAKAEEVLEKLEDKAVIVVDKLEAKIRGVETDEEPVADATLVVDEKTEAPVASESDAEEIHPETEKPKP